MSSGSWSDSVGLSLDTALAVIIWSEGVCFGFLSCCRMNPWASSWDQRMQHRAVRMCLCSCFSKSQTGSSKRSLEHRASSSMFDCWCHTIRIILSHTQRCTKTLCEEVQWLQGLLPIINSPPVGLNGGAILLFRNWRSKTFDLLNKSQSFCNKSRAQIVSFCFLQIYLTAYDCGKPWKNTVTLHLIYWLFVSTYKANINALFDPLIQPHT